MQRIGLVVLMCLGMGAAQAQVGTITTYAGNGQPGAPGNGVPATSAPVTNPAGLGLDSGGNLYIAASAWSVIQRVDAATGIITIVAGGGTGGDGGLATAAQLDNPCDVKVDSAGNIYFSETCVVASQGGGGGQGGAEGGTGGISRIRRVDAVTGIITTIAGNPAGGSGFAGDGGPAANALLNLPGGLAIDAAGNIFIADSGNNRIREIQASTGIITTVAGNGAAAYSGDGGPALSASLNQPFGITVDANGNLYIADTGNHTIRFVNAATGNISTLVGTGTAGFNGDAIPAAGAALNMPLSVVLDGSGNLIIADTNNYRVRTVDGSGLIWTIAGTGVRWDGGDGGPASNGGVVPAGLALSAAGPLLISDTLADRVRQDALPGTTVETAVTLTSSANPVVAGASTTFTFTLVASNGQAASAGAGFYLMNGLTQVGSAAIVNGSASLTIPANFPTGITNLYAYYVGSTGFGASTSPILALSVVGPPTTVSLTASPNPAVASQAVTLYATLSPSTATGSVTFSGNNVVLGSAVVDGSGLASLTLGAGLTAGTYSLSAQYSGDSSHNPASATASLTVQAVSRISLNASPLSAAPGQSVTFTASVVPVTATGSVQFLDGSTAIGTGTVTSGAAQFTTSTLSAGSHSITAVYSGDANDTPVTSSAVTETILTAASITMTATPNPAAANQAITLTSTVTPSSATGSVTFYNGSTSLGSAVLNGGAATTTLSAGLAAGTYSLTASYSGDANNGSATSAVVTFTVQAASSVTVTSSVSPASPGQSVTFTAVVTPATATGSVRFLDGSTVLGTVNLASGSAAYSTSSLSSGQHSITASYSGDGNDSAATSAPITQTILASTSVVLTSAQNPGFANAPLGLTATVTPSSATGTIQFMDGATSLATVTLSGGSAFYSASALGQGTHSLTAVYSGDASNAGSVSAVLQQVMKLSAGMTTGLNPSPAVAGQTVTLSANVAPAATGTVTFTSNGSTLAVVPVSSGGASYSTATLPIGADVIGWSYSGDTVYMSQSTTFTLNVLNPTSMTLTSSVNPAAQGQSVTFTATATPSNATGPVQFYAGGNLLGTVSLSAGVAQFSTSSLPLGSFTVAVTYNGDTTHGTAGAGLSQQVKAAAGLTASASPNPAIAGQTVTLSATVNAAATGTVTFTDGATTLATVAVSSGHATYSTASLAVGSHSIGFSYSGDSNYFAGSASQPETVQAASGVALSSSLNPSMLNQSVTFTAAITPSTATGTVQFLDGGSVIGTASVSSGHAAFSTTTLATGSHTITASYSGDANDTASVSAPLTQTVNLTACHVTYTVTSENNKKFNGAFSIQNTGTTQFTSWNLTWSWVGNQRVTSASEAHESQTGANVTMSNLSTNGSIAPGATLQGMTFAASYSGTNTSPTAFSVNGVACH